MEEILALPEEGAPDLEMGDKPISEDVDRYLYGDRSEFAQLEKKPLSGGSDQ